MNEKILLVDDDEDMLFFLTEAMKKRGFSSDTVTDAEAALDKISRTGYDLVLMDIRLPGMSGLEGLKKIKEIDSEAIVIMMTAYGSKDLAIEALKSGAYDYFTKPFKVTEMGIVVQRALEKRRLQKEIRRLRERLESRLRFERIIGESSSMKEVFQLISRVKDTDITVLIQGESGTGKELIAEAIHYHGPRRERPFVKLNCVAIPETLLESELFGHEKGAFTGAIARKPGKFEQADGGTLFMDEIGDMSLATQAKILRVLQEKEFDRVGGSKPIKVDVRVIAATNKNLAKAVEERKFREDLYYRLNVFVIHLPPLRERKEDIPLLVEYFLEEIGKRTNRSVKGVAQEAMKLIMAYGWPGNVRELENALERALVLTDSDIIPSKCLTMNLKKMEEKERTNKGDSLDSKIQEFERHLIVEALHETRGLQSSAARLLNVSERSLWHRIKKLGIDVSRIKRT